MSSDVAFLFKDDKIVYSALKKLSGDSQAQNSSTADEGVTKSEAMGTSDARVIGNPVCGDSAANRLSNGA